MFNYEFDHLICAQSKSSICLVCICIVQLYINYCCIDLTKTCKVFHRTVHIVFKNLFSHTNRQRFNKMCYFTFLFEFLW